MVNTDLHALAACSRQVGHAVAGHIYSEKFVTLRPGPRPTVLAVNGQSNCRSALPVTAWPTLPRTVSQSVKVKVNHVFA